MVGGVVLTRDATALSFTPEATPIFDHVIAVQVLGDVDGDGDIDVVIGGGGAGLHLYFNDGSGRFTEAPASYFDINVVNPTAVQLVDIDSDGNLDLLAIHNTESMLTLWTNGGAGGFGSDGVDVQSGDWRTVYVTGDVDGDGSPDLLIFNAAGQNAELQLFLNDGSGTLTLAGRSGLGLSSIKESRSLILADFDAVRPAAAEPHHTAAA